MITSLIARLSGTCGPLYILLYRYNPEEFRVNGNGPPRNCSYKRFASAELSSVELPPRIDLRGDVVSYPCLALTVRTNTSQDCEKLADEMLQDCGPSIPEN